MNNDIDKIIEDMTQAFLLWPLPHSVCADFCATRQGPDRLGTNLLSYAEAKKMFSELAKPAIVGFAKDRVHALELENTAALAEAIEYTSKMSAFFDDMDARRNTPGQDMTSKNLNVTLAALHAAQQEVAELRSIAPSLNDQEKFALEQLAKAKDMPVAAIIKQSLRLYQFVHVRILEGHRFDFEIDCIYKARAAGEGNINT